MKFSIDIDCTPEEARQFLGLPNVKPMQEAMMQQVQERMSAAVQAMDPETLMKLWLPAGMQNIEQMQKAFWSQMANAFSGKPGGGDKR